MSELLFRKGWWKAAVLLVYIGLLGTTILMHEPWSDEAQAWLLARDTSIIELFVKYLRYEGSPGLWHLILMVPAKLGLPFMTISILSGVLAAVSTHLFLKYSPFPVIIKLIYPFSFFALYQYSVIARSYALMPLFLFIIAMNYKHRSRKPLLHVFLLILLANVSLHGTLIASGLLFVYILETLRVWRTLNVRLRNQTLAAVGVYGAMFGLLVLVLRRPQDLAAISGFRFELSRFYRYGVIMFSDSIATNLMRPAEGHQLFNTVTSLFSAVFAAVSLYWFILRKKLLTFLVPFTGVILLFTLVYAHLWHQGTLFYTVFFVMWLSYEDTCTDTGRLTAASRHIVTAVLAAALSIQAYWSYNSIIYDWSSVYSAGRGVARYIKDNGLENKRIFATNFQLISILPYFPDNIFINHNGGKSRGFWFWSVNNTTDTKPPYSLAKYDPDVIVLGLKHFPPDANLKDSTEIINLKGYKLVKVFRGALYWKESISETESFAVYLRAEG